jgi:Caspase domain
MSIRLSLLAFVVFLLAPSFPSAATAADRFALVIGNAKYPDADAPLKEPVNDARSIADELKHDGFTVEIGENLTGDGMRKAFERLYGHVKPGSVALVFFSGYGIQSNRQSFMIPVDAQIWTEADVRRDGISLEAVLGEVNNRGAGVKIALIDASRRNPYERRFHAFSAGLAPVIAPNGSLVMYSAALSSVISDNGGDHSLFVQELLKEIRVPNLMAEETLNRTRVGVTRASRSEQVPWISSSLAEDFSFIPGAQAAVAPPPSTVDPTPAPTQPPAHVEPQPPKEDKPQVVPPVAALPDPSAPPTPPPARPSTPQLSDDPILKDLNQKLMENPDDGGSLYKRGQFYAGKGAYELAVKDFSDTIRLNARDVEAYNNRCWVRAVIGDLQPALRDCNEALRLRPNFVDALDSRGLVNLKSGSNKNAAADFDAALRINPRLTSSLYGRGLARQRSGATSDGEVDINNAKAMDPNIVKEFADYGIH